MNKKILFVLALNWILVGCSQAPIAPDGSPLANCRTQLPWFCRGKAQAPTVNVNTKSGKLKTSPYCIKVEEGTQLIFRLTPPGKNALNTVEIIAKNESHGWLKGKNSIFEDLIIIDVPTGLSGDDKYYYGIKTDTDCVDPRIHVKK